MQEVILFDPPLLLDDFSFYWTGNGVNDVYQHHGNQCVDDHRKDGRKLQYVGALKDLSGEDTSEWIEDGATRFIYPADKRVVGVSAK